MLRLLKTALCKKVSIFRKFPLIYDKNIQIFTDSILIISGNFLMLKVFSTEHQDYKVTKATKKCVSKHLCPILFELRYPVTSILHKMTLESSGKA